MMYHIAFTQDHDCAVMLLFRGPGNAAWCDLFIDDTYAVCSFILDTLLSWYGNPVRTRTAQELHTIAVNLIQALEADEGA